MQTERDEDHPHAVWQVYRRVNIQTQVEEVRHLGKIFGVETCLFFLEQMNRDPFLYTYYFAEQDRKFISTAEFEANGIR